MIADLLALASLSLAVSSAIATVILLKQQQRDHRRKTYRVTFPNDLDEKQVAAVLQAISGLGHHASIVFEIFGDHQSIGYRIKIPYPYDGLTKRLRNFIPGIVVDEEVKVPHPKWTHIVEAHLRHGAEPLYIPDRKSDLSTNIITAFEGLQEGEQLLMQWVVSPTSPEHPPEKGAPSHKVAPQHILSGKEADDDELKARRKKLERSNMHCALRIASVAKTPTHAEHLVLDVVHALASTHTHTTKFEPRWWLRFMNGALQDRVTRATTSLLRIPIQLSLPELTALIAWPIDGPMITGLSYIHGKQFPPSNSILSQGIIIGESTYPGMHRPIAIDFKEALMHTWVGGATGVGKTVLLAHMGRQIMEAGHGLVVMELDGNLYDMLLNYVPPARIKDVVLMDFADRQYPVGLNLMDQGESAKVADRLMNLFAYKYGRGIMSDDHILHGMMTLAEVPKLTFMDLAPLIAPTADQLDWADAVTRKVEDPELKRWWQGVESRTIGQRSKDGESLLRRISQIRSRPELRYTFGQSASAIRMDDVLLQNKILLINFKGIPEDSAVLAGTFITDQIWDSIRTVGAKKTHPTYLVMDEFEDFMDLPIETNSMLAQARKYNLGLILANQFISQLKREVQSAIITNARSKIVLQVNDEDGRILSKEIGSGMVADDLKSLPEFQAIASIKTASGKSGPVSIETLPPGPKTNVATAVTHWSRQQYSRPLEDVKKELEQRYAAKPSAPVKKRIRQGGDREWGKE